MTQRLTFILIGLLGGLAFWGLFDAPLAFQGSWAFLPTVVVAASFFFGAFAMLADLGTRRALAFAAAIAVPVGGLALLEGLSFTDADQMFSSGHALVALTVVASLPVPFAMAVGLEGRKGLTDYRVLFIESWNIVVRYLAAWVFVGVVCVVLWLMGALLDLVGVHLLSDLLRADLALWLIVGATLGLGFSVVAEMPDMVSPYLLLRLLRLLTPLVLVVVVIFVVALPLRGLGHLFGDLSAASALLATALAAIGLVSVVVDQDEIEETHAPILAWSARGLALALPVLAGLAIWALALRVRQYGWTPDRVAAFALAGIVAGYGLGYLGALLSGRRWMEKLRQANVAMAFVMIGLAGLWLTPLISPEALAARAQLARFDKDRATVAQLPVWEMAHDWGRPGAAALAELRLRAETAPLLARRLAQLDAAPNRWSFGRTLPPLEPEGLALPAGLAIWPDGAELPQGLEAAFLSALTARERAECDVPPEASPPEAGRAEAGPPEPGAPPCALVLADLTPARPGPEAVFLRAREWGEPRIFLRGPNEWETGLRPLILGADRVPQGADLIAGLLAGSMAPVPVDLQALQAGDWQITVLP
ncbi:DUF4153 domain-containing protein [Rhodobacter sp. TJ_12]|uniref:DUF4153 domain-containing protein n=1 Tax=Rhodobacter sp. TJ_12 TaxID=2029399 RepID=UPI001CC155D2|nr:DUF4153 domain-containing protein [Rhodobacter sp. TJ_12]